MRGVYDDELRTLCRGLLLRDPKRRWGADEVARWLAGDPALSVADDADGTATVVRPYRFGKTEATTGTELPAESVRPAAVALRSAVAAYVPSTFQITVR